MIAKKILLLFLFTFFVPALLTVRAQTLWDANHYEEYQMGDAPIIISSPHGGNTNPGNRSCGSNNSGADTGSQETARLVTDLIGQMTSKRPHLVINHLDRSRLDANRDKPEATCGDPVAGAAWEQYHSFIDQARSKVIAQYGKGHYFDMHGQITHGARNEVGFLLSPAQFSTANLKSISSIRTLANTQNNPLLLVSGQYSIGALISARGYRSVPNQAEPIPAGSYYTGGYNTYRHGSRNGGSIDGTQIESYIPFMNNSSRASYSQAVAEAIVCFMQIYYNFDLNVDLRTRCGYSGSVPTNPPLATASPIPTSTRPVSPAAPTLTLTPTGIIFTPTSPITLVPTAANPTTIPSQRTASPTPAIPQGPRYAACDLCGYCSPNKLPSTWEKCRECLYPNANQDSASKSTLLIDPANNTPPTPYPGRQYTNIGCLTSSTDKFAGEGGSAGFVQSLLNIIFSVSGGIAFLYLLYGAFVMLTSQANPQKVSYGKRLIQGAIIGLIFILLSNFIVNFISNGVLRIPGF